MLTRFLSTLLVGFLASFTTAAEIWVDAVNGNDQNPGTAAQPVKSLTRGLALAQAGDTVFVLPGVYSTMLTGEVFPLQLGFSSLHDDVVVQGLGQAVIDVGGASGIALDIGLNAARARITGLTFTKMDRQDWWTRAINAGSYNGGGSSPDVEIDRCRFLNVNRGIVLWQGTPITGWRIHHNLFVDLGNDGINEFDSGGSANLIYNNTFVLGAHLGVLSDADATLVYNNIFDSQRVGISSAGSSGAATARVRANDFWRNTKDSEGNAFPAGGVPQFNRAVDPAFVSAGGADFRLLPTSPLIDAGRVDVPFGADQTMVATNDGDYDGVLRPDVGAHEYTPIALTASGTSGGTLSFNVTTTEPRFTIGFMLFAFDDGLIPLFGLPPILLDPVTLIPFGFPGQMPFSGSVPLPNAPAGARVVMQGFGFDAAASLLLSGNQARVQF